MFLHILMDSHDIMMYRTYVKHYPNVRQNLLWSFDVKTKHSSNHCRQQQTIAEVIKFDQSPSIMKNEHTVSFADLIDPISIDTSVCKNGEPNSLKWGFRGETFERADDEMLLTNLQQQGVPLVSAQHIFKVVQCCRLQRCCGLCCEVQ